MNNKIAILLFILLTPSLLFAQTDLNKSAWYQNWYVGASGGVTFLATEMKKDFSFASMDMNSHAKGAFFFHLNKRLNRTFEIGLEYEKNYFNADKNDPGNVNWLIYDKYFNNSISDFIPYPIYSKTNITSGFVNVVGNFINLRSLNKNNPNLNFYIKAGAGISAIGMELGYKDPIHYAETKLPQPLYVKGQGTHPKKDTYATFHLGTGTNYYISPRLSCFLELSGLFVSADYLDGVHNLDVSYSANKTRILTRREVLSTVAELKFGFSYHFHLTRKLISNGLWELKYEEFKNDMYIKSNKEKKKEQSSSPII